MKKLLNILLISLSLVGHAQLINPSTVTFIGGDNVTIESCEASINNQSELIDAENANKVVCLVQDIVLSGNITLPTGMTLVAAGGSLDFNGHTITFVDTSFGSPSSNTFIKINGGTIHPSSTFRGGYLNFNWFDLVADGNVLTNTGTDNRNTLIQVAKFFGTKGGTLHISRPGVYLYSLLEKAANSLLEPTNLYFSGRGVHVVLGEGVILGSLTNGLPSSEIVNFWNCEDCSFTGGELDGDIETHEWGGTDEGNHGIKVHGVSRNVKINTKSKNVPGDNFINTYAPEFVYLNDVVEAVFTKNFELAEEDGTPVANTRFSYSDRFNINTVHFNRINQFVFGGGSYSGTGGLDVNTYYVAYYDNTSIDGDTTTGYLGKSDLLETYQMVDIPEGATHIRLQIYSPTDWSGLSMTIYAPTHVKKMVWDGLDASWGVRQGISNATQLSTIKNSWFTYNGRRIDGTTGSPGFGYDAEDGYQNISGVNVLANYWQNNKGGDIILKGPRDYIIAFNRHLYNNAMNWVNVNAVSLANGERTMYYMNVVQDRNIDMGRNSHISMNNLQDVALTFTYENEMFSNNKCFDCRFTETLDNEENGVAYVKDNLFQWTKPLSNVTYVFQNYANIVWIDNIMDFGGYRGDFVNYRLASLSNPGPSTGYIDNLIIKNLKGTSLSADGLQMYVYNVKKLKSSISLDVRRGPSKDIKWEDVEVVGWLYFNLTDYPTTNGGNSLLYNNIEMEDVNIIIDDSGLVGGSAYAFRTSADDVNIEWTGGEIDMQVSSNRFLDLNHYGTTTIKNVTFKASDPQTVNLSTLISGDETFFIDCEFENITLTLRSGDKRLFTKPHADLEVYADNAAALAGGIPPGYMYRTSEGTIRTTFN